MQVFIKRHNEPTWRGYPEPLQAFANDALDVTEMLLWSEWPILDAVKLVSGVRLARRLWGHDVRIGILSPHPSREWLSAAFEAGASYVALPSPNASTFAPVPGNMEKVYDLEGICPTLQLRIKRNVPLSVCGCHRDLMVLARHHFDRWCVGNYLACPHRSRCDA